MKEQLEKILANASTDIENANTTEAINEIKLKYLSRKGELNSIKKNLKDLSDEDKRIVGAFANEVAKKLETAVNEKFEGIYRKELNEKLQKEKIDITMRGKFIPQGKIHPLTSTVNEIVEIFQTLVFTQLGSKESPEVETEYYNFDMLNFAPDHPARDMQDTYYTKVAPNIILRSQTSGDQVREMTKTKPPVRVIAPGRVYRNESVNARKNNFFHQIEGLYVDKGITFGDLKGVLNEFIRLYFGSSRPTRFRSSYFPFTEPSAEIDVECVMCHGKGCRTCSGTGWLEILGADRKSTRLNSSHQ